MLLGAELLTLERVKAVCECLTPVQHRRLGKRLGLPADVSLKITPGDTLVVWVADLLQRVPITDADQRWAIVEELEPNFRKLGQLIHESLDKPELPAVQLGFGDRAFVVLTGEAKLFELATGEWRTGAPKQFFERILYDLTVLYCRRYQAALWHDADPPEPVSDR